MTKKVLILAAGSGRRLLPHTAQANKILLPVGESCVLDQIIKNFSSDTQFVIAVGYRADDVKTYVRSRWPERRVQFADVSPFEGPQASPGFSAYAAREFLREPFYLVYADTLWSEPLSKDESDWLGVASVSEDESIHYCNVEIENERVLAIKYKMRVSSRTHKTYIGLAHIADWSLFFSSLKGSDGHFEIENALEALRYEKGLGVCALETWCDIGRRDLYERFNHGTC